MAADFSDYLSGAMSAPQEANLWDSKTGQATKGTYVTHPNAAGDLVQQILASRFPDYLSHVNTKVTRQEPEARGALADYSAMENAVHAGKLKGDITTYANADGSPRPGNSGADTNDVINNLGLMMHELMHARYAQSGVGNYGINAGKDWSDMLKTAQTMDFPSMGGDLRNGDTLEEFLSTAVPVRQMTAAGMTPTGRFKDIPGKLDELTKTYPWMNDWLQTYSVPETAKSVAEPVEPSMTEKAMGALSQMFGRGDSGQK
jgi:hypothetical protein